MNEPTLYLKRSGNNFIIVPIYIDDIIYMGTSCLVDKFKASMKRNFEMSDLGVLRYFHRLEVKQDADGLFIYQKKYATDLVKKFNMLNCKIVVTPMNMNEKLQLGDGTELADGTYYRSLVGGLIYLTHTRPETAYSMGVISKFMHSPSRHHLEQKKGVALHC